MIMMVMQLKTRRMNNVEIYVVSVVIALAVCLPSYADAVKDILSTPPYADVEKIKQVESILSDNPAHPLRNQLLLYQQRQFAGASAKSETKLRRVIRDLQKLGTQTKESDPDSSYAAFVFAGELLHHRVKDYKGAYEAYKTLAGQLDGEDGLELDYKKVSVYTSMTEAAHLFGHLNEVEKYAKLVMAYPHLGMEDREYYRKFSKLYARAGGTYVTAFSDDFKKLSQVDIYPGHRDLYEFHQALLVSSTGHQKRIDVFDDGVCEPGLSVHELPAAAGLGKKETSPDSAGPVDSDDHSEESIFSGRQVKTGAVLEFEYVYAFGAGVLAIAVVFVVQSRRACV